MSGGRIVRAVLAAAAAAVLGCQARGPDAGGLFVAAPGSTGSLAVRVLAPRRIQAEAGAVEKVLFALTGAAVPGTPSVEVPRSKFKSGKAAVEFGSLLPGTVRVTAELFSVETVRLGRAEATAEIAASAVTQLQLQVTADFASASLVVDTEDLAAPTASLTVGFEPVAPGTWQPAAPMIAPRGAFSAVPIGGKVWAVGGGDAGDQLERYDPATGRWTPFQVSNSNSVRRPIGAAAALRGKILVVGLDTELFQNESGVPFFLDPDSFDAFQHLQPFPYGDLPGSLGDVKEYRTAVAVATTGDQLYVVGGSGRRPSGTTYVFLTFPTVEVLSAQTAQWTERAPLPDSRGAAASAFLGGKLYVAGGFRWKGTSQLDPHLGKLTGVSHVDATLEATDSALVYDPAADRWSGAGVLAGARYGCAIVSSGGKLYLVGGARSDGTPLESVDVFDPVAGTWTEGPDMLEARAFPAAATLPDGKVVVMGGFGSDKRPLRSTEVLGP